MIEPPEILAPLAPCRRVLCFARDWQPARRNARRGSVGICRLSSRCTSAASQPAAPRPKRSSALVVLGVGRETARRSSCLGGGCVTDTLYSGQAGRSPSRHAAATLPRSASPLTRRGVHALLASGGAFDLSSNSFHHHRNHLLLYTPRPSHEIGGDIVGRIAFVPGGTPGAPQRRARMPPPEAALRLRRDESRERELRAARTEAIRPGQTVFSTA